jgi:hypothetical protein
MNKYTHPLAVSHEGERGSYYRELDKYGRVLYHSDSSGYWSMKFYADEEYVMTPYFVMHKYSALYNTLPFYNPNIK